VGWWWMGLDFYDILEYKRNGVGNVNSKRHHGG
jgi:hypothetical protein